MSGKPVKDAAQYVREYEAKKGKPTPAEERNYIECLTLMGSVQLIALGAGDAAKLLQILGNARAQAIRPGPDDTEFHYKP
jgi:hypothetical protein